MRDGNHASSAWAFVFAGVRSHLSTLLRRKASQLRCMQHAPTVIASWWRPYAEQRLTWPFAKLTEGNTGASFCGTVGSRVRNNMEAPDVWIAEEALPGFCWREVMDDRWGYREGKFGRDGRRMEQWKTYRMAGADPSNSGMGWTTAASHLCMWLLSVATIPWPWLKLTARKLWTRSDRRLKTVISRCVDDI